MINSFKGEYGFLSNYSISPIEWKGYPYNSVEGAYIASKIDDPAFRKHVSELPHLGGLKGTVNKNQHLFRKDWHEVKVDIMRSLLQLKFSDSNLRMKLMKTGSHKLIEGNWWNDKFWGVCQKTNSGENMLGKLLMEIREESFKDEIKVIPDEDKFIVAIPKMRINLDGSFDTFEDAFEAGINLIVNHK